MSDIYQVIIFEERPRPRAVNKNQIQVLNYIDVTEPDIAMIAAC